MQCPACGTALKPIQCGEITVDACVDGCGGVWFDNRELRRMDEPSEPAEPVLAVHGTSVHPPERRRNCPNCPDTVMMQHFSSILHQVTVDECPACGGFWLDEGELARIRSEFPTEADRRKAVEAMAAPLDDEIAESRIRSGAVSRVARFLSWRMFTR